jgi:Ala-tRNA(Pro) deacylase
MELYEKLVELLDRSGARYRLIDHPPEGRTEIVSAFRGNAPSQAAKCILLMVKIGKKVTRHVLCVVPGDSKIDFAAVKALFGATYVSFATPAFAEEMAGSVSGTILPFSFRPDLALLADPAVLAHEEIFFNAARLDRSMALNTADWAAAAKPRVERIAGAAS